MWDAPKRGRGSDGSSCLLLLLEALSPQRRGTFRPWRLSCIS